MVKPPFVVKIDEAITPALLLPDDTVALLLKQMPKPRNKVKSKPDEFVKSPLSPSPCGRVLRGGGAN
jgi:hypothetical protein